MWVATVALWIGSLGQCFPTTVRQYTSVPCQVWRGKLSNKKKKCYNYKL